MASFDLTDQPWLPCVRPDGTAVELGLRQTLIDAHALRELYDPSPLVTVALHRLLLAILHRAYRGPADPAAWRAIWNAGRFDPAIIDAYLDRWRHRFDLFDPERPFYQVPFMADLADPKKQTPVAKLAQEAAAGNNATLFDHSADAAPSSTSPAQAARAVVAAQAFSIGFGRSVPFYLSDSTLIRGYTVLAVGDSLFETLALNLMPYNRHRPLPWLEDDLPCWERAEPAAPDPLGTPIAGYVDYLTWQSRQIHLVPDATGQSVARCQFRQNLKLDSPPIDPFKCYRKDEQRGWRPRSFRPQRALWRDSTALFAQLGGEQAGASKRPELLDRLAHVEQQRQFGQITAKPLYRLHGFGLTTDDGNAASVVLWRREELPLPMAILDQPLAVRVIADAIAFADEVHKALGRGASRLATLLLGQMADLPGARQPDQEKAVRPLVRSLDVGGRYWPALEVPFADFLTRLPDDREIDADGEPVYGRRTMPAWETAVVQTARRAFSELANSLDTSARSLKAAAAGQREFERNLRRVLARGVAANEEGGEAA